MTDSADIVTRAFRRLQAIDIMEQPSAAEMSHGLNLMGEMVNGWTARGVNTTTHTVTGTVVDASARIREVQPDTGEILIGLNVSGTGIPANTTVKEVVTDHSFQLSADATANGSDITLTFAFLPVPAKYEGAMVALLAMRLKGDMGISLPADVYMDLKQDAVDGWADILCGYFPDRKVKFDRNIAIPAGTWDIDADIQV
jgi:hypothetical protein